MEGKGGDWPKRLQAVLRDENVRAAARRLAEVRRDPDIQQAWEGLRKDARKLSDAVKRAEPAKKAKHLVEEIGVAWRRAVPGT
jgi:hypothetical protein